MPKIPVDWEKIQMHNWVKYRSVVDDIRMHLNMGEHPTVELIPSPVDGQNHYDRINTKWGTKWDTSPRFIISSNPSHVRND
jgi:hypothetical protein